jgi:maltodextrin utilization protein YvdJ
MRHPCSKREFKCNVRSVDIVSSLFKERLTHYLQTSHYTWSLSLNKDDTVSIDLTLHLKSLCEQGWHSIYRPHITLEVSLWTGMTQYLQTSHYTWILFEQGWHNIYRPHITLEVSLWTVMTQYLQTSHYTWSLSVNKDDTVSTDLTLHLKSLFEQGWHIIYRPHITLEVSLWTRMTQYL